MSANNCRCTLIRHIEELLLVISKENCLILARLQLALSHNQRLNTSRRCASRMGVCVDRDKQVSICIIGNIGTSLKVRSQIFREVLIVVTSIYHLDTRQILLNHSAQLERYLKVDILLRIATIARSGKCSAMTRIYNNHLYTMRNILSLRATAMQCKEKNEKNT